jgi:aspartate carbamoyltransferase catalytic subunit
MALRIQRERLDGDFGPAPREYATRYRLDPKRMGSARDSCVVLHPGPINRGVELSSEVADGPRSLVLRQVENGVWVRMAMFAACARGLDADRSAPAERGRAGAGGRQ